MEASAMTDEPNTANEFPDRWDAELEALIQAAIAGDLDGVSGTDARLDVPALRRTARLVAAAATIPDGPAPPASLRNTVLDAIRADANRTTTRSAVIPPVASITVEHRPLERRSRWRGRRPFAVIAAAAAVVVGALFTLAPGPGTSIAFATELVPAPNSPSPGASGVAQLLKTKHGWVMRLKVTGLTPNPTGAVYQCWYVGPSDGTETSPGGSPRQDRIAVGTFRTKDGSIEVEWPTAADPKRYPKVGITLEPNDGNPLRSGPKVLVGAKSATTP